MLDISKYDLEERRHAVLDRASFESHTWWSKQPLTGDNVKDMKEFSTLLFNRWQIGRFDDYMQELGGFTPVDAERIVKAARSIRDLQSKYFTNHPISIPWDTLAAAYALYKKVKSSCLGAKRILEIGPGAGLNSLFFNEFDLYVQIEATKPLYIMQSMVHEACYASDKIWEASYEEFNPFAAIHHVPWWGIDKIKDTFDVVTANACLNEMPDSVLDIYLQLADKIAHKDTVFIIQCMGENVCRTREQLLDRLETTWKIIKYHASTCLRTWWLSKNTSCSVVYPYKIYTKQELAQLLEYY
jgi:hypothetical protein